MFILLTVSEASDTLHNVSGSRDYCIRPEGKVGERIAVGFGNNIDYEISWDAVVFERLAAGLEISPSELDPDRRIESVRDFVLSILGFVARGAGGERRVEDPTVLDELAGHFQYRETLGGSSVRAAVSMRTLGFTSALHLVTMNDHVRRLIPQDNPWVTSSEKEALYPHVIVQFDEGAQVRIAEHTIRAPRANRLIYVNDPDNSEMKINPAFAELAADAEVFLIAGFNAMDSSQVLARRLETVREILSQLREDATVVFEDACYHEPALSTQLRRGLVDHIDVYGLNEDELEGYVGREVSLLDPADVWSALGELQRIIPVPVLILHTRDWALAFGENAERYRTALEGGITMATTRLRHGDHFSEADYGRTQRLPAKAESVRFASDLAALGGRRVCSVPSYFVEQKNLTTIGLGDAFVGGLLPRLTHDQLA